MKNKFKKVFSTPFFSIDASIQKFDNSEPYYRVNTNDSVICMLINKDNKIILVRQFRPNLNEYTLEFPAGYLEDNENIEHAAQREIIEETGYKTHVIYLGSMSLHLNRYTNKEHLFISYVENQNDGFFSNETEVKEYSICDFYNLVKNNQFKQLAALGIIELFRLKYNISISNNNNLYKNIKDLYESKQNTA